MIFLLSVMFDGAKNENVTSDIIHNGYSILIHHHKHIYSIRLLFMRVILHINFGLFFFLTDKK